MGKAGSLTMPDHQTIYQQAAGRYDRLVSCEDAAGNLLIELNKITYFEGQQIVELGAGTGRLTRLLAPLARTIHAFDLSPHMLAFAAQRLKGLSIQNCTLTAAEHRAIPLPAASADVVISGWSLCYLAQGDRRIWQPVVQQVLDETYRLIRPHGWLILIETLGTGFETPTAPEKLLPYYDFLEAQGCAQTWIRTDYRFDTVAEAVDLTRFFFGDELADQLERSHQCTLPECTGFWFLQV